MSATARPGARLEVAGLGDAMGIGLDLIDIFGAVDVCALWLGDHHGTSCDFIALTEDRGGDVDCLVRYAAVSAEVDPLVDQAVLWRTADDLRDLPALATAFFDRRDRLHDAGVELADEIVLTGDELRSLAVSTLCDRPGWDDVTPLLDLEPADDGEDADG